MKEEFDSPGWTLEVSTTDFLKAISSGFEAKFVMITISQSFPANVLQRTVLLIRSLFRVQHILFKCSQQSL